MQYTGHTGVWQFCTSERIGHATPPWATLRFTARERLCDPLPHVTVQVLQAPQTETTQSTGQ
jgi:hypothetical protein